METSIVRVEFVGVYIWCMTVLIGVMVAVSLWERFDDWRRKR